MVGQKFKQTHEKKIKWKSWHMLKTDHGITYTTLFFTFVK